MIEKQEYIDWFWRENAVSCQEKVPKNVTLLFHREPIIMKDNGQKGFSLIELLLVVAVLGIVAALAVPALQRASRAAENGSAFSTLRTISSAQVNFYSQNGRFARATELNNQMNGAMGANSGNDVIRGKFVISMTPPVPTNLELKDSYTINAIRNVPSEAITYHYRLYSSGEIGQIAP